MKEKKGLAMTRRSLLKLGATAAIAGGIGLPKKAVASNKGRLATLIDLSLCDGCADRETPACVSVCKSINKDKIPKPVDPIPEPWPRKTIEDWSKKKNMIHRLTPYNFIYVHKAVIGDSGREQVIYVPRRCMHCDNPACATICPFSANNKRPNGAVVIDQDLCFGGAKCKDVCPWEIPQRQSGVGIYLHVLPGFMGNGVMYKCDLCVERLAEGKLPACIEACPRQAMLIGPRSEIEKIADERARAMNGFIYGKTENGGTSTFYVSPVSFELINETIQKKPGQPDMKTKVPRRMAKTDKFGDAVLVSPVLGLAAAGALGWYTRRKQQAKKEGKDNG
ncbi:MAG: 4Fe-4S dicluster domain-containing protein [Smithellaceae bacterium]